MKTKAKSPKATTKAQEASGKSKATAAKAATTSKAAKAVEAPEAKEPKKIAAKPKVVKAVKASAKKVTTKKAVAETKPQPDNAPQQGEVKRGPGRPRKDGSPAQPKKEGQTLKTGMRGRPSAELKKMIKKALKGVDAADRDAVILEVGQKYKEQKAAAATAPKRGPGRPRKVVAEKVTVSAKEQKALRGSKPLAAEKNIRKEGFEPTNPFLARGYRFLRLMEKGKTAQQIMDAEKGPITLSTVHQSMRLATTSPVVQHMIENGDVKPTEVLQFIKKNRTDAEVTKLVSDHIAERRRVHSAVLERGQNRVTRVRKIAKVREKIQELSDSGTLKGTRAKIIAKFIDSLDQDIETVLELILEPQAK
jgi:hypothetical protein